MKPLKYLIEKWKIEFNLWWGRNKK